MRRAATARELRLQVTVLQVSAAAAADLREDDEEEEDDGGGDAGSYTSC